MTWWVATTTGDQPLQFARFNLLPGEKVAIDAQGTVWGLTVDGRLVRCAQAGTAYACSTAQPLPLVLGTTRVYHAFSWDNLIVLATGAGLRVYDPSAHAEVPVLGRVQIGAGVSARVYGSHLLLYNGRSVVVLDHQGSAVRATSWAKASALVFDDGGTPWARLDGNWRYLSGTAFVMPQVTGTNSTPNGLRTYVVEGGSPVAIDAAGHIYTWNGSLSPQQLALPRAAQSAVSFIQASTAGDWWLGSGTQLLHVGLGSCPIRLSVTGAETYRFCHSRRTGENARQTPDRAKGCCLVIAHAEHVRDQNGRQKSHPVPRAAPCLGVDGPSPGPAPFRNWVILLWTRKRTPGN